MRSTALLTTAALVLASGCGTPGRNVPVELSEAEAPSRERLVALDVGRLLSADPSESQAAEARLTALDTEGRKALLEHAERIPGERDPRWLHVLHENDALMPLGPDAELEFLLWKVGHAETFYAAKAQGRILELARTSPDLLLARLDRGGRGTDAVALALAMAGEARVVPPLVARYRFARTPHERRVAAEALAWILGEERRPRPQGSQREIDREAAAMERWYREHLRNREPRNG